MDNEQISQNNPGSTQQNPPASPNASSPLPTNNIYPAPQSGPQNPASPNDAQQIPPKTVNQKVPFYRVAWIFGIIYVLLPPIGLLIMLSGDVFKNAKDGQAGVFKKKEEIFMTLIVLILWIPALFALYANSNSSSKMGTWLTDNREAFDSSINLINSDIKEIQDDINTKQSDLAVQHSKQLINDINIAYKIPTMPDGVAAGYFKSYLGDWQNAASNMIYGVQNKSTEDIQKATTYSQQAEVALNNLQNRLVADGVKINKLN